MDEIWLPYTYGPYEVSNFGEVRNIETKNILKNHNDGRGYYIHHLWCRKAQRKLTKRTNIIVCEVFHGEKPFPEAQAAHLNGIRSDNRAENLKWCSPSENALHKQLHGTCKSAINGKNSAIKLRGRGAPIFRKQSNSWQVCVSYMKRKLAIGYFKKENEAIIAYNASVKTIALMDKIAAKGEKR